VDTQLRAISECVGDRYTVERELGRGGMATVYLARDVRHDRRVAIKVLRPELAGALGAERFLREVRVAAQLHHPHVLTLHDSGRAPGISENGTPSGGEVLYYVMPYVEGESLRDRLRREGPLPITDALRIASEVAGALAFAHAKGIVHRDIKPENILLATHGRDDWHALVADFGIARVLAGDAGHVTSTGVSIGTPAYMSPEQALGDRVADGRVDIYSLGCVLYEMLVGEPPFTGPNAAAIVARHLSAPVPSIRTVRPSVSPELESIVRAALEKVPADRIPDADAFKAAVDRVRTRLGVETALAESTRAVTPALPVRGAVRRWPLLAAAAAAVAIMAFMVASRLRETRAEPSTVPNRVPALNPLRVAVPPFRFTGDSGAAYLADASTDDLLAALARAGKLRILARSSVPALDSTHRTPAAIASAVGAGSVVDGAFRQQGDSLTFDVALVDANTGEQMWAGHFRRAARNLAGLQDSVARAITERLTGRSEPSSTAESRLTPVNGAAYDAYLRGTYLASRLNRGRNQTALEDSAVRSFERASELDPSYALPHAAIAAIYQSRFFTADPRPAVEERAFVEVEKALALDPNLAEAYLQKGNLTWTRAKEFPHEAAVRLLRKAADLKPSLLAAHEALGSIYMHVGLLDRALAEYDTALTLDPTTTFTPGRIARVHWYRGQYELALKEFDALTGRTYRSWSEERALVLDLVGRTDAAMAILDSLAAEGIGGSDVDAAIAVMSARQGKRTAALAAIVRAERGGGQASHFHHAEYSIAVAYALLGDADSAITYLRRTANDGMPCYPLFASDPRLRGLARDPRFARFMAESKARWEDLSKTLP